MSVMIWWKRAPMALPNSLSTTVVSIIRQLLAFVQFNNGRLDLRVKRLSMADTFSLHFHHSTLDNGPVHSSCVVVSKQLQMPPGHHFPSPQNRLSTVISTAWEISSKTLLCFFFFRTSCSVCLLRSSRWALLMVAGSLRTGGLRFLVPSTPPFARQSHLAADSTTR